MSAESEQYSSAASVEAEEVADAVATADAEEMAVASGVQSAGRLERDSVAKSG